MQRIFESSLPEQQGIPSGAIGAYLSFLEQQEIALHSFLLMRHGKVVFERYCAPYDENTLHRMYSVSKSFTSLAIGLLCEEGKLSLDDLIAPYFPDKQPPGGVYTHTAKICVRDLLRMATVHRMTAYKIQPQSDWVRAFFTVPPSHLPGVCFAYDTSASHVLAALVERLTGQSMIEYLQQMCLSQIHFSPNAYFLTDAMGVSEGGSGLMATPYDLLRVMALVMHGGRDREMQLLPAWYLRDATAKQIDTYCKPATDNLDELQGYGYQFWRTSHNGFCSYGMGGQLGVCLPDQDLVFVTTADTQNRLGGTQLLFDGFWQHIYPQLSVAPLVEQPAAYSALTKSTCAQALPCVPNIATPDSVALRSNGKRFALEENPMGFSKLCLSWSESAGTLMYELNSQKHTLAFGLHAHIVGLFPEIHLRCAISGGWRAPDIFLVRAWLLGEQVGSIWLQMTFRENTVTLLARKFCETLFSEYDGLVSGNML